MLVQDHGKEIVHWDFLDLIEVETTEELFLLKGAQRETHLFGQKFAKLLKRKEASGVLNREITVSRRRKRV